MRNRAKKSKAKMAGSLLSLFNDPVLLGVRDDRRQRATGVNQRHVAPRIDSPRRRPGVGHALLERDEPGLPQQHRLPGAVVQVHPFQRPAGLGSQHFVHGLLDGATGVIARQRPATGGLVPREYLFSRLLWLSPQSPGGLAGRRAPAPGATPSAGPTEATRRPRELAARGARTRGGSSGSEPPGSRAGEHFGRTPDKEPRKIWTGPHKQQKRSLGRQR